MISQQDFHDEQRNEEKQRIEMNRSKEKFCSAEEEERLLYSFFIHCLLTLLYFFYINHD
jgi:hypothetical protein